MKAKRMGLASRKNMKKESGKLRLTVIAAGTLFLAAIVFIVWSYTLFPLRQVVFAGNRHLSEADMKKLMRITEGEDLLKLSCSTLAGRLLGSPWVRSASIRKEYPGRLLVRIREAEPFSLFKSSGHLFLIDDEGRKLEELKGEAVPFLPTIVSNSFTVEPGAFSEALSLVKALRETAMASRPVEITGVDTEGKDLSLIIDGTSVRVGEGQYGEKLLRFAELEGEVRKRWQKVDYIDLRFANRVVVKPLKEETVQ